MTGRFNQARELSHNILGLLVRIYKANLFRPLQSERPEVEVRIAKAF
jgi:hypothetical protein